MSGDSFYCANYRGSMSFWYIEARDAAKHLRMCRSQPTTKNYLTKIVNDTVHIFLFTLVTKILKKRKSETNEKNTFTCNWI